MYWDNDGSPIAEYIGIDVLILKATHAASVLHFNE